MSTSFPPHAINTLAEKIILLDNDHAPDNIPDSKNT